MEQGNNSSILQALQSIAQAVSELNNTENEWEELVRVTQGASATTLTTATFQVRKYLKIIVLGYTSTAAQVGLRLGYGTVDTGSNYANRRSDNSGADATQTSTSVINLTPSTSTNCYADVDIINVSTIEKVANYRSVAPNASGATNVPTHSKGVGKWANSSAYINIVGLVASTGNLSNDTQIIVYGRD